VLALLVLTPLARRNWHEADEGKFDFESPTRDLGAFLKLCKVSEITLGSLL